MKRLICLFFVLLLCLFCGCSTEENKALANNDSSQAAGVISRDDIMFLNADNESVYRVVRPDGDFAVTGVAQYVCGRMRTLLGAKVRNTSDAEDGTDQYEILLGDSDRPEVEVAREYLFTQNGGRYGDYIICTIGKKIVIFSHSADALKTAAEYFIENIVNPDGIKGGIKHVYKVEGNFTDITINSVPIGRFSFVRPHYNSSYLTELEMEKAVEQVYSETGYRLKILHDTYHKEQTYEIIVGDCEREGVEKITGYDDFKITVSGTKVFINGGSAHATAMGVAEFSKSLGGNISDSDSVVNTYSEALRNYDVGTTLYKTWGEDFDGEEINTVVWRVGDPTAKWEGLNGKAQVRSSDPDDVYIKDGCFYITAREDDEYYYGGVIQTYGTYKYGYIEMSSKIPHGRGFWTALYLCSDDRYSATDLSVPMLASPEYDVMECFGNSEHYQANIHSWPRNGADGLYGWEHISLDNTHGNEKRYHSPDNGIVLGYDFHTYGMMWDSEKVTFTCDGDAFFSYDTTTNEQDIETNNHNVWIRIAMNVGSATNPEPGITEDPNDWRNTGRFVVDWVNVYQKNDGKCTLNGSVLD